MHPNPAFRKTETTRNIAFARERGFGILSVNGAEGPLMAHVPFTLNEDGSIAALHLVRSNPILKALETPQPAVIAVNGPDGYVSPDWYGVEDQVPTWNYVAVHLRGELERRPQDVLPGLLEFQSYAFESRIKRKAPWRPEKMTPEVYEKMQRAIVPVRLNVETVDGTWKLGQNKPEPVRHAASRKLRKGLGQELAALAALMRRPDVD
ncbi:FMN-binding negative transcriptional regulator [Maritimibacter sp. UBA3975]|uniref:FMN-binding negative transcriptional regulator n=1 Tax=Maritimibacter sp. UBA3975 TaxID=1946833 RepID=UPI000C0B548B|nr:FMN-binding negative transcriptional regulator [Maritimibacter sp. UBA3975]MAM63313.1 negative transcriptional regulator [Maritimibacter sp.]|tara:strand:+ start:33687 stop:34307 length:621 start_codon:yes stop_codon:yes gene_type:complete